MFVTLTLVETLVRQTRKHDILDTKTAHHAQVTRKREAKDFEILLYIYSL